MAIFLSRNARELLSRLSKRLSKLFLGNSFNANTDNWCKYLSILNFHLDKIRRLGSEHPILFLVFFPIINRNHAWIIWSCSSYCIKSAGFLFHRVLAEGFCFFLLHILNIIPLDHSITQEEVGIKLWIKRGMRARLNNL